MKLESYESRIDELAQSATQISNSQAVSTEDPQPAPVKPTTVQSGRDNQQLRLIIREELTAALRFNNLAAENTTPEMDLPVYDEAEMQYQRQLVLEELEALKAQVEVTSGDMEKLMLDIARLDPEARIELIKKLNQALNRGEIKGSL